MAVKLWLATITKSLNGRSDRDTWNNQYGFALDAAIDSDEVADVAGFLVAAEQKIHYDRVYFNQVHVKQIAENAINLPADQFRTLPLSVTGNRNTENLLADDSRLLPLEVCLGIKRGTKYGRGGRLYMRGCLLPPDMIISDNNYYAFSQSFLGGLATNGVSDYLEDLNGDWPNGAVPIMPDKVDTLMEQFAQRGRVVDGFSVGGIYLRDRSVVRVSSERRLRQGAQRRLTDLGHDLKALTSGTLLDTVAQTAAIARIAAEAIEVIEAVPFAQYKSLKIPANLKALPGI